MSVNIVINEHSSVCLRAEELTVYFDPFHIKNETRDADIILITHEHYDHFSPEDIKKVCKADTVLAAPVSIQNALKKAGFVHFVGFLPGETKSIKGVLVQALPAYNRHKPFHPKKNGWLGYVVTLEDKRYYVAGDTDALEENKDISCDTAFLPVGGTYTMNAKEAAGFANALCPKTVIPTHYGSVVGNIADGERFEELIDKGIKVEKYIK